MVRGPRRVLALIAEHPGVQAPDLAEGLGRKTAVQARRAQAQGLGLTVSLEVGYRLSPRGGGGHQAAQRPNIASHSASTERGLNT